MPVVDIPADGCVWCHLQVIWTKTAGYVDDCHVVVGTPDCLAECLQDPNAQEVLQHTQVRNLQCVVVHSILQSTVPL